MKKNNKNNWRPLATIDSSLTTTGDLLATTDDHWRPLATICRRRTGSALMMTLALTVLLAILGAVFVLMARMEKTATAARSESEELKLAADSIVNTISQRLADDLPQYNDAGRYYDYPGRWDANGLPNADSNDAWLANLEPESDGGTGYQWRHITDIYGVLSNDAYYSKADICPDNPANISEKDIADADGDGVSDARWVKVPNLTTSKGKPIYTAVRIIDNGGMLNVNTAYQFDPTIADSTRIDGSSQMQINLAALSARDDTHDNYNTSTYDERRARLFRERFNATGFNYTLPPPPPDEPTVPEYDSYKNDVVWRVQPFGTYTPFDISDELNLRNRYILGSDTIATRIEDLWTYAYNDFALTTPRDNITGINGKNWFYKVNNVLPLADPNYDYRHISTTYNMDRIIDPYGAPKRWVNDSALNVQDLYDGMLDSYDPNWINIPAEVEAEYAQIAVSIKDYRDTDANITTLIDYDGKTHYGIERPLIYVTELAWNIVQDPVTPTILYRSYAIEVYSQLSGGQEPNLVINGTKISNAGTFVGSDGSYYVFRSEDALAPLAVTDPNTIKTPASAVLFDVNDVIKLVCSSGGDTIVIDSARVPSWFDANAVGQHSYQRDMRADRLIQRTWNTSDSNSLTLGSDNGYASSVDPLQVFLADAPFRNVGDVGLMFKKPAYYKDGTGSAGVIGYDPNLQTEENVRINLADPNVQKIFNYITVFNPSLYDPTNGTRIKGRININTAPWFVLAQLPWVSQRKVSAYNPNYALAKAMVAYRDKTTVQDFNSIDYSGYNGRSSITNITGVREEPGFASIGELTTVVNAVNDNYSMWYYALDPNDQADYPDLSGNDGVANDFEEQNLIFARISDLVTVRSDVFTVYILIRLGDNGPQRRVMAILDRSQSPTVKIVAMQEVPDAR